MNTTPDLKFYLCATLIGLLLGWFFIPDAKLWVFQLHLWKAVCQARSGLSICIQALLRFQHCVCLDGPQRFCDVPTETRPWKHSLDAWCDWVCAFLSEKKEKQQSQIHFSLKICSQISYGNRVSYIDGSRSVDRIYCSLVSPVNRQRQSDGY